MKRWLQSPLRALFAFELVITAGLLIHDHPWPAWVIWLLGAVLVGIGLTIIGVLTRPSLKNGFGVLTDAHNPTRRLRKVLALSRTEISRMGRECIDTEHVLLGIIAEGQCVAAAVLHNVRIDPDAARQRVEVIAPKGKGRSEAEADLPLSSGATKALELALEESLDFGYSYVGTEHLLIGLAREEKGVAARVLREFGGEPGVVRQETLRLLGISQAMTNRGVA